MIYQNKTETPGQKEVSGLIMRRSKLYYHLYTGYRPVTFGGTGYSLAINGIYLSQ